MTENAGSIEYTVDINTGRTLRAQDQLNAGFDEMGRRMDRTDDRANELTGGLNKLAAAVAAVVASSALREMARLVQGYQEMSERVQMATGSQAEFELVQQRLMDTANGTYRSLAEAQELYIRTADALRSLGYTTEQALDVTDSMSYAFVTNATSADRANAAISAMSKSVNTGKVAADQWETITSAIPTVIDDIAEAAGKSSAEIRALGAAGKLTATQLTEGLRQSLDDNAEAAAKMAANLTDAGVRARTALTVILVAAEKQTGLLQDLTDGIVDAANALLEFGGDANKMAEFLSNAETALTAVAAVLAGRLFSATAAYLLQLEATIAATLTNISAQQAATAATLRRATVEKAAALAALEVARAEFAAAQGTGAHAIAANALITAQTRAATAAGAYAAAQNAANNVASRGAVVMTALSRSMAFLGGPVGVILLAATALYAFSSSASEATPQVDALSGAVGTLGTEMLKLQKIEAAKKIDELGEAAKRLERNIKGAEEINKFFPDLASNDRAIEGLQRERAALEENQSAVEDYAKRMAEIDKELEARAKGGGRKTDSPTLTNPPTGGGAEAQALKETKAIEKQIDALQLQADTLGMTANELEIYKLQLAGATDEQLRAAQSSLSMIDAYEQISKAEEEMRKRREAFGTDPAKKILGQVDPLSGGAFDDQTARYEAEKAAEDLRYADQLERLRLAKEAQVQVIGGYQALEEQMAQTHADRLAQIEQAKNQVLLSSGESLFGSLAEGVKGFVGESSAAYQALFAVSKAFAIANAGLNLSSAISQAMADPTALTPAQKFANMAAVAAAGGEVLSQISSAGFTGRANGGPVQAGQMYRVNETGAPEVYNAANGQQYMLPNQRGQVVSNTEATSGAQGITNYISIEVDSSGTSVSSGSSSSESVALAQSIRAVVVDELERQNRQGGILWNMRVNGNG